MVQAKSLCALTVFGFLLAAIEPAVAQQNLQFRSMAPCRLLDTRNAGPQAGVVLTGAPLTNPGPYFFRVQGNCGVAQGAEAVSVNATVVSPSHFGDLRAFQADLPATTNSIMAYVAGQTLANGSVIPLGDVTLPTDKDIQILFAMGAPAGSGSLHLIIDINGYFVPVP